MTNMLSALKLEYDSYVSLHIQLHNQMRQLIASGRWRYGDRIPGESQLAKYLNISRTTVRIALQRAEIEGLIRRVPGRGTFVAYRRDSTTNTRFIGYVTRSFHNEIHRVLLSSAEDELRSAGYRVIFSNAKNNDDEVSVLRQLLEEDKVSGLILWPNANPTAAQRAILWQYQAQGIPVVFIDRFVDGVEADYVTSDNFGGTYALVKHLIDLGHQHIVYMRSNLKNLFPVDERHRGYESAIDEHGLHRYDAWRLNSPHQNEFFETDIYELLDDHSAALIEQITGLLESTRPRPTAVACVNDALAIITMKAIRKMRLKVPDDISVVGFDDIDLAAYMDVPLTTATQNAHEIGRVAAQMLVERLDGSTAPPRQQYVPTRLQIRMSATAPIVDGQSLLDR